MAKLSNAHKELIIKVLACYHSPSEAIELLKNDYGVKVDFNQVSFYNVGSLSSARLADHWRELFHKTRENYISEAKAVPIANKGYRHGELQKIYDRFVSDKKYGSAARILEQTSVEMGSDGPVMKAGTSHGTLTYTCNRSIRKSLIAEY